MPTYCYTCRKCGATFDKWNAVANFARPERCPKCRGSAPRDLRAEHGRHHDTPGNWPLYSEALGVCCPDEIPARVAEAHQAGCDISFDVDGRCKIPDKSTWIRYCRNQKVFDKGGAFSPRHH